MMGVSKPVILNTLTLWKGRMVPILLQPWFKKGIRSKDISKYDIYSYSLEVHIAMT